LSQEDARASGQWPGATPTKRIKRPPVFSPGAFFNTQRERALIY
jgi:hypothetical protein